MRMYLMLVDESAISSYNNNTDATADIHSLYMNSLENSWAAMMQLAAF